ncbi:PAS domain-containing serine/threonine-protein kinase isoform X2 [Ischnura elegans]|uniref:PAS domain-containing serine/threonine-protein kinase isoform X2 n=1 Tax=Ischnura elegans TaxID=197161 RepID=UPI001ED8BE03|nr:PAS domain-containing serine/threonine-protein kinase isoform X2 [Ischnura elegans]
MADMAQVSNGIPALDFNPGEIIWEKFAGKVNLGNRSCHSELDKLSDRNSYGGKLKERYGVRLPSFEANQSFPRSTRPRRCFGSRKVHRIEQPLFLSRLSMDHISGDGQHSLSYTSVEPPFIRTAAGDQKLCSPSSQVNSSFLSSFGPLPSHNFPVFNPSKAVFTIDTKSTEILVVNDAACNLLEYPASELVGIQLKDLLGRTKAQSALSEEHLDGDLTHLVSFCGKVVEMVAKDGRIIPVSLWVTQLQSEETGGSNRCLAVAEPVERAVAQITIDKNGMIMSADKCTAALFQYDHKELIGMHLSALIPSIKLPTNHISVEERKQKATGRTLDGESFPISLLLSEINSGDDIINYSVTIWKVTQIIPDFCPYKNNVHEGENILESPSVLNQDESNGCGYEKAADGNVNSKVLGLKGRQSLASVDEIVDSMGKLNVAYFSLSRSETDPDTPKHQRRQRSLLNYDRSRNILDGMKDSFTAPTKEVEDENQEQSGIESTTAGTISVDQTDDFLVTSTPAVSQKVWSKNIRGDDNKNGDTLCEEETNDTPSASRINSMDHPDNGNTITSCGPFSNGEYYGYGLHKDGALLSVKYRVQSAVLTESKQMVYCVWVAKNTSPDAEVTAAVGSWDYDGVDNRNFGDLTLSNTDEASSATSTPKKELPSAKGNKPFNGTNQSLLKNVLTKNANLQVAPAFKEISNEKDESEDDYASDGFRMEEGEYDKRYSSLYQIGKGAFGCVCMGYRKNDRLLVITKFIRKDKVCEESWVVDPKMGRRVPLEISLLTTLNHPNIVSVIEVCENPSYFQLVMEKHGAGMDLFEFIDRNPDLDEPLISYIFRQVASAVKYLHSLQILHRDIKDENIILNEAFQVKLIDFGSATFSSPRRLFSNFYGTVEYCSPEVLAGNKYAGPELEMWSMGVTLYVLCFGENPFFDVEETLKAELNPPYTVSEGLQALLESMLEKDPIKRCTVDQLVNNPWLNQNVDISQYVFSEVVQCKPHEENPPTHFDEGEDIESSYFNDMSDGEEIKNGGEECPEGGRVEDLDASLRPSFNGSSHFASFSRVSPTSTSSSSSSSSSDSIASSGSYHSASHSRASSSSSSTMTSTRSIISGGGHDYKDNDTCMSLQLRFAEDELDSEMEPPSNLRSARECRSIGFDPFAVEDFKQYDDLDDSPYDEQDSFS